MRTWLYAVEEEEGEEEREEEEEEPLLFIQLPSARDDFLRQRKISAMNETRFVLEQGVAYRCHDTSFFPPPPPPPPSRKMGGGKEECLLFVLGCRNGK